MAGWEINFEQRVTLNLSTLARSVVEQDMLEFHSKSRSDFVCRVFEHFYQVAEASIGRTLKVERNRLEAVLAAKRLGADSCRNMVDAIIENRREQLCAAHIRAHAKGGAAENIRLQNDTMDSIKACQSYEERYYPWISGYVRAVIEEYCRLPYVERERIYFKKYFDAVTWAIQEKRLLEVTVQDKRRFLVLPCFLKTDSLDSANYLAGFSRIPGEASEAGQAASFRIASLVRVRPLDVPAHGFVAARATLEKLIEKRGIQFLLGQETQVRIRLTPNGQFRLSRMTALRPRCIGQEGDVYTFECTQLQAEYYFTAMGADCEVLEPLSLRQRFAELYDRAAKLYET